MSDYHLSSTSGMKDEYVHEVCRYGGAEPHALAALVIPRNVNELVRLRQYDPFLRLKQKKNCVVYLNKLKMHRGIFCLNPHPLDPSSPWSVEHHLSVKSLNGKNICHV